MARSAQRPASAKPQGQARSSRKGIFIDPDLAEEFESFHAAVLTKLGLKTMKAGVEEAMRRLMDHYDWKPKGKESWRDPDQG